MTTRITKVEVRDVMKINYVEVAPEGSLTIIGGNNEQGKSSFLNAIAMCLGGRKLCPSEPIRKGESEASVSVNLSEDQSILLPPCRVTRTFTRRENGTIKSELEIETEDGYKAPTPQSLLDDILTYASFDPLAFTRLKPADQANQLKELVGLDFTQLDEEYAKKYQKRTELNRMHRSALARLSKVEYPDDTPDEEVDVSKLTSEMRTRSEANAQNQQARTRLSQMQLQVDSAKGEVESCKERVEELKTALDKAKEKLASAKSVEKLAKERYASQKADVKMLQDADVGEIQKEIDNASVVNKYVRRKKEHEKAKQEADKLKAESDILTARLSAIQKDKSQQQAEAEWPIEGLGFGESGVTYNGLPFSQASSAEQTRISVAMGFALNPKLPMLIIRDGSLLDDKSLAEVATMAAKAGGQVFMERVGEGSECHIVLEDGSVKTKTQQKELLDSASE